MFDERLTITRQQTEEGQGQQSEDVLWVPDTNSTDPIPVWSGYADVQEKPATLGLLAAGTPDVDHDALAFIRNWRQAVFVIKVQDKVHIDWMNQHESEATVVGIRYTDGALMLKYLGQPTLKTLIIGGGWRIGDPNVRIQ